MAIPLYTIVVGALNQSKDRVCRIKSLENTLRNNNYVEFCLDDLKSSIKPGSWSNYVIGVVACFKGKLHPFDAVIKSNVPLGSGLSSSAALEVSVYTFLESLFKSKYRFHLFKKSIRKNKMKASSFIKTKIFQIKKKKHSLVKRLNMNMLQYHVA
jgi:galactokinase